MIKIKEIKTVISKCTGIKLIELNDDSYAADFAKWDSLAHVKLLSVIEKKFKISINEANIDKFSNITSIFNFLSKKGKLSQLN